MQQIKKFKSIDDFKLLMANNYQKQVINYLGDEKKALKFLSSICASIQRTPKLLECEPLTVINSFMMVAELGLMPSDVAGEAYVLPYGGKAQFQLGYQGLITLFYRAGARSITAEIVYKNDKFDYTNGIITHSPDVFSDDRGEAIGAYVIVENQTGGITQKVMKKSEILGIGQKFSKSYNSDFSPWKEKNDPNLWMWKKTVLKQVAKLVPKNETLYKAIAEDNKDSNIAERNAKIIEEEKEKMKMGNLLKINNQKYEDKKTQPKNEHSQSDEEPIFDQDELE